MKLQPPYFLPDELVRLMVLCCLTYLGPCTDQQLLEWVSEYDVMNYFDLMIALSELCKQGQAECRQKRRKTPGGGESRVLSDDRWLQGLQ